MNANSAEVGRQSRMNRQRSHGRYPGKTLRDAQGQASDRSDAEVLDLIITNALIIDWAGIYKADIGVKNGIIVGIGKGGNPDVMDGVTDGMVVGSSTEVIAGEKMIITAGAIDAHVHYICVDLWKEVSDSDLASTESSYTAPGSCVWNHYPDRWRDWSIGRKQRDDLHVKQVLHESNDDGNRWHSNEFWVHWKGQRLRRKHAGAEGRRRSRRYRTEIARGLGHYA